ncbi:MAG: hypothetical protein ACK41T_00895 [Pseudobdellovibrio sp.]
MKTQITTLAITLTSLFSSFASANIQTYTFKFKSPGQAIKINAESKEAAYKIAAKECYKQLTGGQYPGEEKGLEYIDICANPKM